MHVLHDKASGWEVNPSCCETKAQTAALLPLGHLHTVSLHYEPLPDMIKRLQSLVTALDEDLYALTLTDITVCIKLKYYA